MFYLYTPCKRQKMSKVFWHLQNRALAQNRLIEYLFKSVIFLGSAYLAQSPQLYKQMVIAADFDRVYTIGGGKYGIISEFQF